MAMFVHLAPASRTKAILRSGLRKGPRGVYAMPVTRNYVVSHQWLRELKRRGDRTFAAVHVRIPDDQPVLIGHYARAHVPMTAAEAVAVVLKAGDALGYEVRIPRSIRPGEIHAVRAVRQVLGWRYFPGAHGRKPCGCPVCLPRGEMKSRKIRRRWAKNTGRTPS